MKRLLTLLILLTAILSTDLKAQNRDHRWAIGAGVSVVDFSGPMTKEFFEFDQFKGIGRVYFSRYLNSSLNTKLDYNFGKVWAPVVDPVNGYPNTLEGIYEAQFMHAASLTLEYKFDNGYIFREEAVVGPYIFAGIGGNYLYDDFNSIVPVGFGLNIRPTKWMTLNMQFGYNFNIDNSYKYTQHSFGAHFNLGKGKTQKEPKATDADGDGISDNEDECPFSYGTAEYFGCPDSDGDGVADSRDNCPYQKGSAENKGCPETVVEADTDSDGVPDKRDDCPNEEGPASNNGCPETDTDGDGVADSRDACPDRAGTAATGGCPDSDGDGVADKDDNCPTTAGLKENAGCPADRDAEVKDQVYFEIGSINLTAEQKKTLDNVAQYLEDNPDYDINVVGHASTTNGTDERNMALSIRRAEQVYLYLRSKGVESERMTLIGKGSHDPEFDSEEDAKNRRVQVEVYK